MAAYIDVDRFSLLSTMPKAWIVEVEVQAPGWILAQLEAWSRTIDARLRKRYKVPFADPAPDVVQLWLARIVTKYTYLRRGVRASDEEVQTIFEDADNALKEIQEAADSKDGLYDLPLLDAQDPSGISKGGPLASSQQSPYVWTDEQACIGRQEDMNGRGSTYG